MKMTRRNLLKSATATPLATLFSSLPAGWAGKSRTAVALRTE